MTHQHSEAIFGGNPEEVLVCTLFEGDYHYGLAALINSLVGNGFQGCIAAGYRGALPPWIGQMKLIADAGEYEVSPGVRIEFIRLDTPVHFTYMKAPFMQRLIRERGCKYICYFDPDIVVRCAWSFYVRWVRNGVALCEDVNGSLPANHPLRHLWAELVLPAGLKNPQPLSRYYNAGFIGLPSACGGFLDLWQKVIGVAESAGLDKRLFAILGDRTHPFHMVDQDPLNIATMYTDQPLTTMGPVGMGFVPGSEAMLHAVGSPKPWRRKAVLSALQGVPPSNSVKGFLANLTHPIRPYSGLSLAKRRLGCRVGAMIGRFYGRR